MSTAIRAKQPAAGPPSRRVRSTAGPSVRRACSSSLGREVFSSRRRARRPRSFRSTRPLSASSTIRSASLSASSMIGALDRGVLAHVVEDRALGAAGDDRVGDALDPDPRAVPSPALLADDRLDRVDLVRPRVLAEAEEDHPASVRHERNSTGSDPAKKQCQLCNRTQHDRGAKADRREVGAANL